MSSPLDNFEAIIKHLSSTQSGQVYRTGGGTTVSVNVRVDDWSGTVTIHHRESGVIRLNVGLAIRVTDANREALELTAQTLNRTGLGASVIVGAQVMNIFTQVPIGKGSLTSRVLDRSIELCIERAKSALPILKRVGKTGLASV